MRSMISRIALFAFLAATLPSAVPAEEVPAAASAQRSAQPISMNVRNGKLLIDGVVAKEGLHYSIDKAASLSFYLPGTGTLVMTTAPAPDATAVKSAIRGNVLSFAVAGHTLYLMADDTLTSKTVMDAYVHLDKTSDAAPQGKSVQIGYSVRGQALPNWLPANEPTIAQK
jgi:hypothetical protein